MNLVRDHSGQRARIRRAVRSSAPALAAPGGTTSLTARKTGRIGSIEMERTVPLAIGGKFARDGSMIKSAADQFNGAIAYPILELVDQ